MISKALSISFHSLLAASAFEVPTWLALRRDPLFQASQSRDLGSAKAVWTATRFRKTQGVLTRGLINQRL